MIAQLTTTTQNSILFTLLRIYHTALHKAVYDIAKDPVDIVPERGIEAVLMEGTGHMPRYHRETPETKHLDKLPT